MDPRVAKNLELSRRLGWTPADFGAHSYDEALIRAIEAWQHQRVLPVTGIADGGTMRVLLQYRKAWRDSAEDRRLDAQLGNLGAVHCYEPDDPRVTRSAPFMGVQLHVPEEAMPQALLRPMLPQVDVLVVPMALVGPVARLVAKRWPRQPRVVGMVAGWAGAPHKAGQELGRQVAELGELLAGVVLQAGGQEWAAMVGSRGQIALEWATEIQAKAGIKPPLAVLADLWRRTMELEEKRAWRGWGVCDVAMYPVQGRVGWSIESVLGSLGAEWSIFGQLRPSFQVPLYAGCVHATVHEVHRYRAWLAKRGMRGYAVPCTLARELLEGFMGAVPDKPYNVEAWE